MQAQQIEAENALAQLDADTRENLLAMERDMRESLAEMEIGANERDQMAGMATSMFDQYQKSISSILANPNLSATDRNALLKSSGQLIQHQMDMVKSVFGLEFDWLDSSFNPSTGKTKEQEEKEARRKKRQEEKDKADGGTTGTTGTTTSPAGNWPVYPGR